MSCHVMSCHVMAQFSFPYSYQLTLKLIYFIIFSADIMPNIEWQVQSLLDIIELILNKLEVANVADLKAVLEESINEIVVIKSNLSDFINRINKDDDDIYLKITEEESNTADIAKEGPIVINVKKVEEVNKNEDSNTNDSECNLEDDDIYLEVTEEAENTTNGENNVIVEELPQPIVINVNMKKGEEIQKTTDKCPLYLCPQENCAKNFKKVVGDSGLMTHLKTVHDFKIGDLKCPMCSRNLSSRESLFHHIKKKHDQNLDLQCKICLKEFAMNQSYHLHMNSYHGKRKKRKEVVRNRILGCAACSHVTNNEEDMVRHKLEEHGIERKTNKYDISEECEFCGFWKETLILL